MANREIIRTRNIDILEEVSDTIESEDFWRDIQSLLCVVDKLVAGITIFESDTPRLAQFYQWYHEQLKSKGMNLIDLFLIYYIPFSYI